MIQMVAQEAFIVNFMYYKFYVYNKL